EYPPTDPNSTANPNVVGAAYSNNFPGATTSTLFVIDSDLDILATQNPPDDGTLNTINALGVNTSELVGFDISGGVTPVAFASLTSVTGLSSELYTIDTVSGAASLVGAIGPEGTFLRDLTVAPAVDLEISKADAPDPVLTGDILTYTITVTNN